MQNERCTNLAGRLLTQTLREIERDGYLIRTVHPTIPPRVEYQLTDLGRSLAEPLAAVRRRAEEHINEIEAARTQHDANHTAAGL